MKINIKTKNEINKIKESGKIASELLEIIKEYIKPGITSNQLNNICHKYIKKKNAYPASLGYLGYPKSVCISINDVVCHGIPNDKEMLKEGDIINIDVIIAKNGYHADTSKMYKVGKISKKNKKLLLIAKKCLYSAIKIIKPGICINKIGKKIQKIINTKKKLSIIKEFCGHGIGKKIHEEPQILHYYNKNIKTILKPGMTFTIEPIINTGKNKIYIEKDGWTIKTIDKSISAQYEHTITVTKYGYEILTLRNNEKI